MSAVVQLADVTVRRGNNVILNDLDWTVMDDERWVIAVSYTHLTLPTNREV